MTTIKDVFGDFIEKVDVYGEMCIGYSVLRSNLRVLEEVITEIDDEQTTESFEQFSRTCEKRHNVLLNKEVVTHSIANGEKHD